MKLAIIVFLIGGGSSFNGGNNYSANDLPTSDPEVADFFTGGAEEFFNQAAGAYQLIFGAIILLLLLILFLSYISSVMEFVFVDSLVSNDVRFWEYSRRYLRKGLGLFVLRILIVILLLAIMAIMALPFLLPLIESGEAFSGSMITYLLSFIFLLILIFTVVALVGSIISSFVNLAIPVAIYTDTGIFHSFSEIFGQFRKDWKQILVYWVGRFFLHLAVGIAVIVVLIIPIIGLLLISLLIDALLYFALSPVMAGGVWFILGPVIFIQAVLLIIMITFIAMPVRVFMKYHMLTFLQQWYPEVEIPVFDTPAGGEATSIMENRGIY